MLSPVIEDELLRAEAGYLGAAALLCALLAIVYQSGKGQLASSQPSP